MVAINLQTRFLAPPCGFALFYLRGVASASATRMDIHRGSIPFVPIKITSLCIGTYWMTWLPKA
ncbi:TRAP transporter large permease subunit [Alphaproteobacteria bacterium]|nr:TRAP transporter large permease subunit [Alphaproteobacteria bacterium]